jgi:hypothetical protein
LTYALMICSDCPHKKFFVCSTSMNCSLNMRESPRVIFD